MTLRFTPAVVALARLVCASIFLAGCATAPQESPTTTSNGSANATASLRSLRIGDGASGDASPGKAAEQPDGSATPGSNAKLAAGATPALPPDTLPAVELHAPPIPKAIDLTRETNDLFQRLRNGFAMPDINNDLVLYHQQWYMNRPDYLRRMVERSSLYMHHIIEELEKRGMPTELALLPMVESAYNPMALSRSKASGLWQFVPATGKQYNLDQNWWKDERRDIVASTSAALDYLQAIYEMHGDWQLALASYNWGEGSVGRAIAKNRAKDLPTDYLSLTMPNETKNYVPKLQALKNIFGSPALMAELSLPSIPNRPYFATVAPSANIDVKIAAKLAEMPEQEFVALNPSNNRPVITSETLLVLPADKVDTFMSNLEAHEDSKQPLSSWQTYTLRRGEKLSTVAKRFGMTLSSLKSSNGISRRTRIRPGMTLLVADNKHKPPTGDTKSAASASVAAAPASNTAHQLHTVRKGDTLFSIARKYGTTVAELKAINAMGGSHLAVGEQIEVASVKQTAASDAKPRRAAPATPVKIARYKIRRGDTLNSIARQFKVTADDILRWNSVSPRSLIPGKTLTIQLAQNP